MVAMFVVHSETEMVKCCDVTVSNMPVGIVM